MFGYGDNKRLRIEEERTELAHYYYLLGKRSASRRLKAISKIIFIEATNLKNKPVVIINEVQSGGFLLTMDRESGKEYMLRLIAANARDGNLLKPSGSMTVSYDGRCLQPFSLGKLSNRKLPQGKLMIDQ